MIGAVRVNEPEQPPEGPQNFGGNSVRSENLPNIEDEEEEVYEEKGSGAGRQRGKDRKSAEDGVRQLFELWWYEHPGPYTEKTFELFFVEDLSDDMRKEGWGYYPKHYIRKSGKSHAEYLEWRREFRRKFGTHRKFTEYSGEVEPPDRTKITPIRRNRA